MKTPHMLLSLGLLGVGLTATVGTVGWWVLQALVASMDKTVVATQAITLGDLMHAQKGAQEEVKHVPAEAKSHAEGLLQHIHQLQGRSFPPELQQGVTRLGLTVARYADEGQEIIAHHLGLVQCWGCLSGTPLMAALGTGQHFAVGMGVGRSAFRAGAQLAHGVSQFKRKLGTPSARPMPRTIDHSTGLRNTATK